MGKYILDEAQGMADDFLHECYRIPHDRPPKWLLVLTAYLDESGQEQDDWMFIAGFYGNDEAWRKVDKEWRAAIGPQRKHLHMTTDLRWKKAREQRMLARAGAVPNSCGLIPIVGGVRQGDFKDLICGSPEQRVMSGYVVCLWSMLFDTLRGLPQGETLELVFEVQQTYQWYADIALRVYVDTPSPTDLLPDGRHKLVSWKWVTKDSTSLTEPADYFAFALSKAYREPGSVKDHWCRPILKTRDGTGFGAILSRDKVREAIKNGMLIRMIEDAQRTMGEIINV